MPCSWGLSEYSQGLREILPPIVAAQLFCLFSTFDVFFLVFSNLKFPTLWLDIVRALSGVSNLASKCDSSISFRFRDVMFLNFSKILKFFKELRFKKKTMVFKILN